MHLTRRVFATTGLSFLAAGKGLAQDKDDFPARPIRLIVPFAAGGAGDVVGRFIATGMQAAFNGRPVVVDNRGGASGTIATESLLASPADGHTVILGTITNAVLPTGLVTSPRLDPRKAFEPVSLAATLPMVLSVNNAVPAHNLQELLEVMRKRPGELNYGSTGVGSALHLGSLLINMRTGTRSEHIPYRGGAPALTDLIAGNIQWLIDAIASQVSAIQSGQIRALALLAPERSPLLPDVPTAREQGLDVDIVNFHGIFTVVGTPTSRIERLESAVRQAVADPVLNHRLREVGCTPVGSTTTYLRTFWQQQFDQWLPVIQASGMRPG